MLTANTDGLNISANIFSNIIQCFSTNSSQNLGILPSLCFSRSEFNLPTLLQKSCRRFFFPELYSFLTTMNTHKEKAFGVHDFNSHNNCVLWYYSVWDWNYRYLCVLHVKLELAVQHIVLSCNSQNKTHYWGNIEKHISKTDQSFSLLFISALIPCQNAFIF